MKYTTYKYCVSYKIDKFPKYSRSKGYNVRNIKYLTAATEKEDRFRDRDFKTNRVGDFVSKCCGLAVNIGPHEYEPHTDDIEEANREIEKYMRSKGRLKRGTRRRNRAPTNNRGPRRRVSHRGNQNQVNQPRLNIVAQPPQQRPAQQGPYINKYVVPSDLKPLKYYLSDAKLKKEMLNAIKQYKHGAHNMAGRISMPRHIFGYEKKGNTYVCKQDKNIKLTKNKLQSLPDNYKPKYFSIDYTFSNYTKIDLWFRDKLMAKRKKLGLPPVNYINKLTDKTRYYTQPWENFIYHYMNETEK